PVNGGQRNRGNQIDCPYDVEQPDERPREGGPAHHRGNCDERQRGGNEVAEGRRICESLGDAGKNGARSEEHQAEVAQGMQQENWQHDGPRLEPGKDREEIKLRRDRKNDRAEQQIEREDVHLRLPLPSSRAFPGGLDRFVESPSWTTMMPQFLMAMRV